MVPLMIGNSLWCDLCIGEMSSIKDAIGERGFGRLRKGLTLMLLRMLLMVMFKFVYCLGLYGASLSFRSLLPV